MPVMTYTVSSTIPVQIWPAGKADDILVRNTGSNIVRLGDVNNSQGLSLGSGSSMIWNSGIPLYASMFASGVTTTLDILDNGGNLFDASAIAAQITLSGAPPVNVHDLLLDTNFATGNGATSAISVAKYQSLMICVYEYRATPTTVPVPRTINLGWLNATGGVMEIDAFQVSDNNGQGNADIFGVVYICPVKAISLSLSAVSTARSQNVHIMVMGTYKTVPTPSYHNDSAYYNVAAGVTRFGSGAYQNFSGSRVTTTALLTSLNDFPAHKSGYAAITNTVNPAVAAGSVTVSLTDAEQGSNFAQDIFVAASPLTAPTKLVYIPNRPCQLVIAWPAGTTAGSLVNSTLVFVEH